jgi:hypothetical protein
LQEIVRKKYKIVQGITLLKSNVKNSPVWNDLLKVKHIYLKGRIISVGNGPNKIFWEDLWCGMVALKDKFKELFEVCTEQDRSVAYMAARGWRMNFRRWLNDRARNQLRQMRDMLAACRLSNEGHTVRWI